MSTTQQLTTHPSKPIEKGFITILTGLYSYQDCLHFIASIRKFHDEPIVILIDSVPLPLRLFIKAFKDVWLVPAPANSNPVLASRLAKISLYSLSPFQKTIYLDCDICLLDKIDELFDTLNDFDLLLTEDIRPKIKEASNLLRVKQDFDSEHDVIGLLQRLGLQVSDETVHYNSGLLAFRRSASNEKLFTQYTHNFQTVRDHQDVLLLRDQGALAAAIEVIQPTIKTLSPKYNFLDKWKRSYSDFDETVKVLHCTYPLRPQYAKNITRSLYLRVFDRLAAYFLPNQVNNPWRKRKAT